jgi:hypothetical protein
MNALHMQYDCHQLVPAAMMRVAATPLVTIWIVCSDEPRPIGHTEQAGRAVAAATCLVNIFVLW